MSRLFDHFSTAVVVYESPQLSVRQLSQLSPNQILAVSPNASKEEIKKAFRAAACHYHPDKPQGSRGAYELIEKARDELLDAWVKHEKAITSMIKPFLSKLGNLLSQSEKDKFIEKIASHYGEQLKILGNHQEELTSLLEILFNEFNFEKFFGHIGGKERFVLIALDVFLDLFEFSSISLSLFATESIKKGQEIFIKEGSEILRRAVEFHAWLEAFVQGPRESLVTSKLMKQLENPDVVAALRRLVALGKITLPELVTIIEQLKASNDADCGVILGSVYGTSLLNELLNGVVTNNWLCGAVKKLSNTSLTKEDLLKNYVAKHIEFIGKMKEFRKILEGDRNQPERLGTNEKVEDALLAHFAADDSSRFMTELLFTLYVDGRFNFEDLERIYKDYFKINAEDSEEVKKHKLARTDMLWMFYDKEYRKNLAYINKTQIFYDMEAFLEKTKSETERFETYVNRHVKFIKETGCRLPDQDIKQAVEIAFRKHFEAGELSRFTMDDLQRIYKKRFKIKKNDYDETKWAQVFRETEKLVGIVVEDYDPNFCYAPAPIRYKKKSHIEAPQASAVEQEAEPDCIYKRKDLSVAQKFMCYVTYDQKSGARSLDSRLERIQTLSYFPALPSLQKRKLNEVRGDFTQIKRIAGTIKESKKIDPTHHPKSGWADLIDAADRRLFDGVYDTAIPFLEEVRDRADEELKAQKEPAEAALLRARRAAATKAISTLKINIPQWCDEARDRYRSRLQCTTFESYCKPAGQRGVTTDEGNHILQGVLGVLNTAMDEGQFRVSRNNKRDLGRAGAGVLAVCASGGIPLMLWFGESILKVLLGRDCKYWHAFCGFFFWTNSKTETIACKDTLRAAARAA